MSIRSESATLVVIDFQQPPLAKLTSYIDQTYAPLRDSFRVNLARQKCRVNIGTRFHRGSHRRRRGFKQWKCHLIAECVFAKLAIFVLGDPTESQVRAVMWIRHWLKFFDVCCVFLVRSGMLQLNTSIQSRREKLVLIEQSLDPKAVQHGSELERRLMTVSACNLTATLARPKTTEFYVENFIDFIRAKQRIVLVATAMDDVSGVTVVEKCVTAQLRREKLQKANHLELLFILRGRRVLASCVLLLRKLLNTKSRALRHASTVTIVDDCFDSVQAESIVHVLILLAVHSNDRASMRSTSMP